MIEAPHGYMHSICKEEFSLRIWRILLWGRMQIENVTCGVLIRSTCTSWDYLPKPYEPILDDIGRSTNQRLGRFLIIIKEDTEEKDQLVFLYCILNIQEAHLQLIPARLNGSGQWDLEYDGTEKGPGKKYMLLCTQLKVWHK